MGGVSEFTSSQSTLHRLLLPSRSFYQVHVIVLRDGVELNSFAVKLRFHRLPVYPAGVRGVDLSVWVADIGLTSLNGFKLVVTRLASPDRIKMRRLFLAGICKELDYLSPLTLSRGFCSFCA